MHDHSRRRTFLVRNPSRKGVAASDPIGRRPRPRGCSRPSMSTGRTDRKKYASWHLLSSYRCWRPERAAGRLSARALGLSLFLHRSMETFHRRLSSENKRVWDVCALWRRCRGLWALGAARRVGAENVVIGSQSTLYRGRAATSAAALMPWTQVYDEEHRAHYYVDNLTAQQLS